MQSSEHIYELRETITLILWQNTGSARDWEGCGISAAVSLRFRAPGKKFWLAELNQVFTLQLIGSVVEGEPYSSQASFQILRTFGYCSLKWQVYLKHASHYNNNTHQFLRTSIFSGTGLDVPYVESLILITTSNKDSSLFFFNFLFFLQLKKQLKRLSNFPRAIEVISDNTGLTWSRTDVLSTLSQHHLYTLSKNVPCIPNRLHQ